MEKFIVTTGKTIDLAVTAALQQLGMDRDSVSVEVLENAKSGFLGIGASPAKVKVTYEVPDEPKKPEAPMSVLSSASRSKPKERPEITSSIISRPGRKIEPEEQQPARRERRPRQERRKPQNAEIQVVQDARCAQVPERTHGHDLRDLLKRAGPAGEGDERLTELDHLRLAFGHVFRDDQLRQSVVQEARVDEKLRLHTRHTPAGGQNAVRQRAHQT